MLLVLLVVSPRDFFLFFIYILLSSFFPVKERERKNVEYILIVTTFIYLSLNSFISLIKIVIFTNYIIIGTTERRTSIGKQFLPHRLRRLVVQVLLLPCRLLLQLLLAATQGSYRAGGVEEEEEEDDDTCKA